MGTRFVQRDAQNKIIGSFGCKQEGYAEEEIDESHPDFVEWSAPKPRPVQPLDRVELLVAKLKEKGFITDSDVPVRAKSA